MSNFTATLTPNSHGVHDAVISCIDYRFRPMIAKWITEELGDQADLIAVAGAAKTLHDATSLDYILGLIKIARDLHGVTTVHILNHVDCGAYGGSKMHESETHEKHFHAEQCDVAANVLKQQFPELTIRRYLVDFNGVHPMAVEAQA